MKGIEIPQVPLKKTESKPWADRPWFFEFKKEYERTIDRVDFGVIKDIFTEIRRKSGVEEDFQVVDKRGITVKLEALLNPNAADYSGIENKIRLFYPFQTNYSSHENLRNEVLSNIMHEETHAAGKVEDCSSWEARKLKWESFFSGKVIEYGKYGYSQSWVRKGEFYANFNYFNEGVTDKIAEEVYEEYLKRTGETGYFLGEKGNKRYSPGYLPSRALVTAFIEVVASSTHMPSDKIWEAIMQGYMIGLKLDESELKEAFDEIFYKGFVDSIGVNDPDKEEDLPLGALEVKLKQVELDDIARERIKKAFDDYLRDLDTSKKKRPKKEISG